MSNTQPVPTSPIRSEFADDPDFDELLRAFTQGLGEKRAALEAAFRAGDLETLSRRAHQLKGAGGGYGFPGLTECAAVLESSCKTRDPHQVAATLQRVLNYLDRIE